MPKEEVTSQETSRASIRATPSDALSGRGTGHLQSTWIGLATDHPSRDSVPGLTGKATSKAGLLRLWALGDGNSKLSELPGVTAQAARGPLPQQWQHCSSPSEGGTNEMFLVRDREPSCEESGPESYDLKWGSWL